MRWFSWLSDGPIHDHEWTPWCELERGKLISTGLLGKQPPAEVGNYLVQERKCKTCGFRELNTQRTTIDA